MALNLIQASLLERHATLPVVDFTPFLGEDPAARSEVVQNIAAACESIGFFYVKNHGVPRPIIRGALEASGQFFALPAETKRRVCREPGHYRGYIATTPFATDQTSGEDFLYEAFIVGDDVARDDERLAKTDGLYWPNNWPDDFPFFRAAICRYRDALHQLCGDLLRAIALGLGQAETIFDPWFQEPLTNLSLLHYPARPAGRMNDNAGAHFDSDVITILLPGEVGGLQVMHRDGHWIEAQAKPGCFVINIGNMLETWSGGRFQSTMHRVHPPRGRERYSIGYFAHPRYDTVIEPLPGLADRLPPEKPSRIHSGRDLARFVSQFDA